MDHMHTTRLVCILCRRSQYAYFIIQEQLAVCRRRSACTTSSQSTPNQSSMSCVLRQQPSPLPQETTTTRIQSTHNMHSILVVLLLASRVARLCILILLASIDTSILNNRPTDARKSSWKLVLASMHTSSYQLLVSVCIRTHVNAY